MPNDGDDAETTPAGASAGPAGLPPGSAPDLYWMGVGIRLGLEHPDRARAMLAAIDAGAPTVAPDPAVRAPEPPIDEPVDPSVVPVRSMLLARAALLPLDSEGDMLFGWANRLTPSEIPWMGRVSAELIAQGADKNTAKGIGLAWSGGAKLPQDELRVLFSKFSILEITLASVLAGRDLRQDPAATKESGIGAMLTAAFLSRSDPLNAEANSVMERSGEPAKRGLVAIWNTWAAMRYRTLLPSPMFDSLVRPWVTVVGRLPEP